jgi:hypothetical protein
VRCRFDIDQPSMSVKDIDRPRTGTPKISLETSNSTAAGSTCGGLHPCIWQQAVRRAGADLPGSRGWNVVCPACSIQASRKIMTTPAVSRSS